MIRRLLIVSTALLLASCNQQTAEPRPPVIIVSIDTLRSDHLPAYGYHGVRTPAIDAFAREAIVYERAYSHCPLTLPSHATIFTGLLPAGTGVRDNAGFQLTARRPTLAQILKEHGYVTGGAVSAYVMRGDTGINRGFDFYDDHIAQRADQSLGGIQRSGTETEEIAEKWVRENAQNPMFFFLHLYEPHAPYNAPEPYRSRFKPYDAEIAQADAVLGRFFGALRSLGLYDRALIILLSDHGEGLGEHGEDEHGIFLYREAIQVPLMVKLPAAKNGSRVERAVALSDVMPSVLDHLHFPIPAGLDGRSVFNDSAGSRSIYSETFYPRLHFGWSDLHSLTDGVKHYIEAPKPELYDLRADPRETMNLVTTDRRSYSIMKAAIAPLMKDAAAPSAVSAEEAANLAALGYLNAGAQTTPGVALPDPKDKRETFRALRSAFSLFRAGRNAEALREFEQILRENPGMTDVWDVAAKAHWRLGQAAEAIAAAKEGLKSNPGSAVLAMTIADFALNAGDLDDAQAHAELALQLDPARAHEILARVFMARGDLRRAEAEALQATTSGDRAAAYVTLARVLKQQDRFADALANADEALRIIAAEHKPAYAGLSYLRGDLLARLGRNDEAEQALREEIALSPSDAHAYQSLIVLLVSEGKPDEVKTLVYQLIDAAPSADNFAAIADTLRTLGDTKGAKYWATRGMRKYPRDPRFRKLAS
ncbi:MAG: sulfatase-like hydrolase/transferase [Thermoanaerobaculia bacterium]